jgi:hypothetical protein
MKTLRVLPCRRAHDWAPSLLLGQRCLLWGYTLLFAFLLPFICWGALAAPGHPHRTPHFVFADPAFNPATQSGKVITADQHSGAHPVTESTTESTTEPGAICHLLPKGSVAGRAAPTLLLFSILLLLLTEMWTFKRLDHATVGCCLQSLLVQAPFIAVPLPPPRPLSSGIAY